MKLYKLNGYDVFFRKSTYQYDGSLAITAYTKGEYGEEQYAHITVCIGGAQEGCNFVDVNNLPNVCSFLNDNNIAEPTGTYVQSGYCMYPEYRFDSRFLKEDCV